MKIKNILSAAAIAMLPVVAGAATIVVPAAGTGPGANNSQWQSELTLHSSAPRAITLSLSFHQGASAGAPVSVTLAARETLSIADVVKTKFGVTSGTGAIVIAVEDKDARSLAVTSRTFNASAEGEFGQDIPAYVVEDEPALGDIITLAAPSNAGSARFNFGLYAAGNSSVTWELVRANGTVAATRELQYTAGQHVQYNSGIESLFGATPQNSDTVYARVSTGNVIAYGSAINNLSGDPSFVPSVRTREDILIQFLGVDLDEDGTIDVADADHDGTLDAPLDIQTSLFPNYFRVLARGEFGEPVTLTLVNAASVVDILNPNGTVRVTAYGDLKNTTGTITFRGTAEGATTTLTIPVRYK
ncbi:MAG TPA: hypothetical protein VHW00_16355 [Thermoanaerobaculia bacterium]|nr:hypothetical protein [Thermoanaerobaculia bacterium]